MDINTKEKKNKLEIAKMFYKSGVIECVFMEHLINYDYKNAVIYKEKLDEIFVDLDMFMSENCKRESDYKQLTDGLMYDKDYLNHLLQINKMYHDYDAKVGGLFDDIGMYQQDQIIEFDLDNGGVLGLMNYKIGNPTIPNV
jgi:hypothetical protein